MNGKIEGHGTLHLGSGDRYEGDWKDGKRDGQGVYYYHDGDVFEGEWKNDERHGRGIMTYCTYLSRAVVALMRQTDRHG